MSLERLNFDGQKPEALLHRVLTLTTQENDWVLDSFLGSGSTAAAAHKMKRRWLGIELGEQANTHCHPRLKRIIKSEDIGGITKLLDWKGGGGFKFYTLAPSLVQKDKYGTEIINPQYNANMLAAAMAKQEGFRYQPDENNYWKQGMSSEKDFIFTTTQFVTVAMLDKLAEELKPGESLLVCCKSFAKGCANRHTNITIKKIPQMLLGRCEFGKDDYSFNIVNLPHNDDTDIEIEDSEESEAPKTEKKNKAKKEKDDDSQSLLF
jgi:adenine-specific DNA-methyltransferase